MIIRTKYTIWLAFLLVGLFAGCADLEEDVDVVDPSVRREMPDAEFNNVRITHTVDGEVSFVVDAPLVHQHDRTKTTKLFGGIKVDFYEDGRINSHMIADSGVVLQEGRALEAFGHVRVVTDSGLVIETERMKWNKREQLVRSDTLVQVTTQWDTLIGDAMVASDDLTYRKLTNPRGVSRRNQAPKSERDSGKEPEAQPAEVDTSNEAYWDSLRTRVDQPADSDSVQILPIEKLQADPFNHPKKAKPEAPILKSIDSGSKSSDKAANKKKKKPKKQKETDL